MKTHDTQELKLRASSHARYDHIRQGTYGDGSVNGHVEFKACAIGCLSTPHRKKELIPYLREHQGPGGVYLDDDDQRASLAREFGLTKYLVQIAEGLFEGQPTHGAAINFVKDFAYAVPEGTDIRPQDVNRWLNRVLSVELRPSDGYTVVESAAHRIGIEDVTKAFLKWLKGGARVQAA